jgi:hypothetical protein
MVGRRDRTPVRQGLPTKRAEFCVSLLGGSEGPEAAEKADDRDSYRYERFLRVSRYAFAQLSPKG